ncbi:MAG: YggS family pyridoxal phosphate-dependent enzyme [Selenomonadaceae bacterium]|nr:YggS family pyridoxal phosphate-dependent enzyme [Selenomonadaceae bacterium]
MSLLTNIKNNLQALKEEIARAIERRRTEIQDQKVTLIAVTKNHGVDLMREAIDLGVDEIGENRIQEASEKFSTLDRKVKWHLIGHLQTNKVKPAVKMFDLIHSVDSEHLAESLNRAAKAIDKVQDILIQINLANEVSKTGVSVEEFDRLIERVNTLENLRLRGLMLIAPNYEDVEECRPLFRSMYEIFQRLKRDQAEDIKYLSMGMTHDYKIAIEEGANMIRVGTAIFGQRDYNL